MALAAQSPNKSHARHEARARLTRVARQSVQAVQQAARQADVGAVDRVVERGEVAGHYCPKPAAPSRLLSSQRGNVGRLRNVLTRVPCHLEFDQVRLLWRSLHALRMSCVSALADHQRCHRCWNLVVYCQRRVSRVGLRLGVFQRSNSPDPACSCHFRTIYVRPFDCWFDRRRFRGKAQTAVLNRGVRGEVCLVFQLSLRHLHIQPLHRVQRGASRSVFVQLGGVIHFLVAFQHDHAVGVLNHRNG